MKYIIILISFLTISCSSPKRINKLCSKCPTKDSIYVTSKEYIEKIDTFYTIKKDSTNVKITINCDSLLRPQIIKTDIKSGKQIKSTVNYNDSIIDNIYYKTIYIDNKIDSQQIAYSYYNKFKKETKDVIKTITVPVEKKLTKLQKLFITLGKIFTGIFVAIIGYFLLLLFLKLK